VLRLGLGAWLVCAVACSDSRDAPRPQGAEPSRRLSVYTVNHPLAYFAARIGGEHVEVVMPAPSGIDPAFWKPSPETIAAYQSADLLLENGAGYAAWTKRATLPRASRVDTSAGFRDRLIVQSDAVTHAHGPGGDHSHATTAFTTWLDPTLALEQANAIARALIERRPLSERDFSRGLAELEADLLQLDQRLENATGPLRGQPLLFSHPVYQYLARRYDLEGRSLHLEPGEPPTATQWRDLEALLREQPARLMLFEGEPHPEAEARLRAQGVRTVVFEPSGNRPAEGDWLTSMRANAERLEKMQKVEASAR